MASENSLCLCDRSLFYKLCKIPYDRKTVLLFPLFYGVHYSLIIIWTKHDLKKNGVMS